MLFTKLTRNKDPFETNNTAVLHPGEPKEAAGTKISTTSSSFFTFASRICVARLLGNPVLAMSTFVLGHRVQEICTITYCSRALSICARNLGTPDKSVAKQKDDWRKALLSCIQSLSLLMLDILGRQKSGHSTFSTLEMCSGSLKTLPGGLHLSHSIHSIDQTPFTSSPQ